MTEKKAAQLVRKALTQVFGSFVSARSIEASVQEGDPFEWSRGALATVSMEHGLPGTYEPEELEAWCQVNEILIPQGIFCEAVNGGVQSVHKC